MAGIPSAQSQAHLLFAKELQALCTAAQNDGISPELSAAYAMLGGNTHDLIWGFYADRGLSSPRLQYLYCLRHVYRVLLGAVGLDVDYTEADVEESLSDEAANLLRVYTGYSDEIKELAAQVQAGQPRMGTIPDPTLRCLPAGVRNPNGDYYRGVPLSGRRWP